MDEYYDRIDNNQLAVFRGVELSLDDQIRRDVITKLICHFSLRFSDIDQNWGISFADYFSEELRHLENMMADELLFMDSETIRVEPKGRLLIRNICMQFDAYLKSKESASSFSKVI